MTATTADLSMNETPYPPPPAIAALITADTHRLHRYPSNTVAPLIGALAGRLGVPAGQVLVGPGSAGLIQHLIQSLGPARTDVIVPALSFEAYPLLVANAGARPVPVAMAGLDQDLDATAAAITGNTRCVLLCNPNNPTGTALRRDALHRFLDRVPPDVPVILDEAYREFVTDPDVPDGVELARGRDNVCVTRTFSKAYGLAALRIGYAVAPQHLAGPARMTGAVFFPNTFAQNAALACLDAAVEAEVTARCTAVTGERDRLTSELTARGIPVAGSQANFVWLPLGDGADAFTARCAEAGILVRGYPGVGVRVTVGTTADNDRLLSTVAAAVPR
ncbi:aminotransferase class I/II-fold pyridoxal phosphate-dependent enzyme [Actinoplanes derwentensis]|uniref:Histidinol-phosphate aminotransferase n=1 Tax=Actinoplanes derwentensis TaxID=113562 RepID=A0A1H1W905_9ACTN|nr:aminotransferase class I/II-fold pyridoxal phosphate-dependent enzyme [Actinoplanes derwentensis]GID84094.1 putative phenylalanine aminotransferase [Actinoplanes derwentensis]SDS93593.1 histidinol-phosphate aminotransferase [Actinoplanes derwentensis]